MNFIILCALLLVIAWDFCVAVLTEEDKP